MYENGMINGGYPNGYPPNPMWQQQPQQVDYQSYYQSMYSPFIQGGLANDGQIMMNHPQSNGGGNPFFSTPTYAQQAVQPQSQQQVVYNAGYNPYAQYGVQQPVQQPQPMMNNGYPYANYNNGYYGGYGYNYGYNNYYAAQYNNMVNEQLYQTVPYDPYPIIRDHVLSDEDKRLSALHTPRGYAYNGAPCYDSQQITDQRKYLEEQLEFCVEVFTSLSLTASHGIGRDDKREDLRKLYEIKPRGNQSSGPDYSKMTPEQIEFNTKMSHVDATINLEKMFQENEIMQQQKAAQDQIAYAKIKESHDNLLGLKKEEMNLDNYMKRAGLLLIDAARTQQKRIIKDGRNKYDRESYQNQLISQDPRNKVPISIYTDDDYIPIEARIKNMYMRNKTGMIRNPDGSFSPSTPPPKVDPEVKRRRDAFIESATRGIKV